MGSTMLLPPAKTAQTFPEHKRPLSPVAGLQHHCRKFWEIGAFFTGTCRFSVFCRRRLPEKRGPFPADESGLPVQQYDGGILWAENRRWRLHETICRRTLAADGFLRFPRLGKV